MLRMGNMENSGGNCPVAPPSQVTVHTRVLHRACQIAGGVESLATRLRVPVATLYRWLDGEAEPPTPGFLKAGDIGMPAGMADEGLPARALRAPRPKNPLPCPTCKGGRARARRAMPLPAAAPARRGRPARRPRRRPTSAGARRR